MAVKIRRRSRLRRKEATDFLGRLADEFGMEIPLDDVPLDEAEAGPHRLLLRNNDAIAIFLEGRIAPTIRGLLAFPAKKRAVTVDMGAVRFIYNGADVMAPGIVDARPIASGRHHDGPGGKGQGDPDDPSRRRRDLAARRRGALTCLGCARSCSTSTGRSSTRATPGSRHSMQVSRRFARRRSRALRRR